MYRVVTFLLLKLFLVCLMTLSKSIIQGCSAKIPKFSRCLATRKVKDHRTRTPKSKQTVKMVIIHPAVQSYKQRAKGFFSSYCGK